MLDRRVSHYRLVEACAGGAMGRVYKARDENLEKDVALKFLARELAENPASAARFRREAVMAASLDHQHICTIHEVGHDQEDSWFIAMDWYDGGTLAERLQEGPLPVADALRYAREAALGLACAHRHEIVHRDIKPANIAFNLDDDVKLLDFGVALLRDTTRLTRRDGMVGTVGYLAPEQIRGEEPTFKVDIWALGIVFHEMLTGKPPFPGEYPAAVMFAIAHEEPQELPADACVEVAACRAILARCLEKDPDRRYASAEELAAALQEVIEGQTSSTLATPGRSRRRRTTLIAATAALALALAAYLVIPAQPHRNQRGVAVLPFTFLDQSEEATALGAGLGWFLADRLSRLEQYSDAFWIVPPGDVDRFELNDGMEVASQLGVRRTVKGQGRIEGGRITLNVVFADDFTGERRSHEFQDDAANVKTWQRTLPAWLARTLDPELGDGELAVLERGCTLVPAAFISWLRGLGWVWRPLPVGQGRDSVLTLGIDHLAAAVASDSSFASARADFAWASYRRDWDDDPAQAQAAIEMLRTSVDMAPEAVWPLIYMARWEAYEGNREAALRWYDRALVTDPVQATALNGKADVLRGLGRLREATGLYEFAGRQRPDYTPHLLAEGRYYWATADFESARAVFARAAELSPRSYYAHRMLGAALFELGRLPEAEAAFLTSIGIKSTSGVQQNLATLYYYDGRFLDAARAYQRALRSGVTYDLLKNLAEAWRWSQGYEDSARATYLRAARMLESKIATGRVTWDETAELATFWSFLGERERADTLLAELTAADTAGELDYGTCFYIAVVHEDLGRRQEALSWLETALERGLLPTRPERYPGFRNLRADPRYRQLIKRIAVAG